MHKEISVCRWWLWSVVIHLLWNSRRKRKEEVICHSELNIKMNKIFNLEGSFYVSSVYFCNQFSVISFQCIKLKFRKPPSFEANFMLCNNTNQCGMEWHTQCKGKLWEMGTIYQKFHNFSEVAGRAFILIFLTLDLLNVAGIETSTDPVKFTSDCLLQRRRTFHENLLEKVKDYHEVRGYAGSNWGNKTCMPNFGVQAS